MARSGYKNTAARKAALKKWQMAGAASRKRSTGKALARNNSEEYTARRNKIYAAADKKMHMIASGRGGNTPRAQKLVKSLKGTMSRSVFNKGYKRK